MSVDWRWQSNGGFLLDGTGDIALTTEDSPESLLDMVRTRLKTSLHGWKLYPIGADLENFLGELTDPELELRIARQAQAAITYDFLPAGMITVETLADGSRITVLVYLLDQLLTTATIEPGKALVFS